MFKSLSSQLQQLVLVLVFSFSFFYSFLSVYCGNLVIVFLTTGELTTDFDPAGYVFRFLNIIGPPKIFG